MLYLQLLKFDVHYESTEYHTRKQNETAKNQMIVQIVHYSIYYIRSNDDVHMCSVYLCIYDADHSKVHDFFLQKKHFRVPLRIIKLFTILNTQIVMQHKIRYVYIILYETCAPLKSIHIDRLPKYLGLN